MKKFIIAMTVISMCLSVTACGDKNGDAGETVTTAVATAAVPVLKEEENPIRKNYHYTDGSLWGWDTYEYDDQDRLTFTRSYDKDGKAETYTEEKYAEDGTHTETVYYLATGALWYRDIYEYEDGVAVKKVSTFVDGTVSGWSTFEYDERGLLVKDTWYDENGNASYYYVFEYDGEGKCTKGIHYAADGTLEYYYEVVFGVFGRKAKEIWYNADGTLDNTWCGYEYNDDSRR